MARHLQDRRRLIMRAHDHARREAAYARLYRSADAARLQDLGGDVRDREGDELRDGPLVDVRSDVLVDHVVPVAGETSLDHHLQAIGRRHEQDRPRAIRRDHHVTGVT